MIRLLNANFINYKVDRLDSVAKSLMKIYAVNSYPCLLILSPTGSFIMKDHATTSSVNLFKETIKKAITIIKKEPLEDYYAKFINGNYNQELVKELIIRRQEAGINDNHYIVEKYVDSLEVNELNRYEEVLFILKAGPLLDGRAYKLISINKRLLDSVYKKESALTIQKINERIIENSMNSAIHDKNYSRARLTSNFIMNLNRKDYRDNYRSSQLKLLEYHLAIKDTMNYLNLANNLFDGDLKVDKDSIERYNRKKYEQARSTAFDDAKLNQSGASNTTFKVNISHIDSELNNAAYNFYRLAPKNSSYLNKALGWSKKAIELSPNKAAYYDTMAHLLYKLSFYTEAEIKQQKAIELAVAEKTDHKKFEDELKKIKMRSL